MKLDEATLQSIHNILDGHQFEWINKDRVSNDWKQRIYEHTGMGLQLSLMDKKRIAFRLETKVSAIEGIVLRDKCPVGATLDASYSNFKRNRGFCYFAESVQSFSDFVGIYTVRALGETLESPSTLNEYIAEFEASVDESMNADVAARNTRLAASSKRPSSSTKTVTVYSRNPDVVAHVLLNADGKCERCGESAPFIRRSNSTPYLEVHHVITLANGGDDSVGNAIALCPNCHREAHYGAA